MYLQDTIAAIATAQGEAAVAIVRVSGPDAESVARKIFVRTAGKNGKLRSHVLYHGSICDPQDCRILDRALVAIMRGPHSYTGEDVLEIQCHGGAFLVRQILGLVLKQGVRHAERGEFTKRAFLNGRIDLSQAEAVLDLIRARTDAGIDLALRNAGGSLSRSVERLREELLALLVQVEAAIDFPDEEIELLQREALIAKAASLRDTIGELIATYRWGRLHREGARVCICGRPNVGKSSLLNALLDDKRVIVSDIPGTTRDVVEDSLTLDGLPVVIWDTAGIRDSDDVLESMGASLSRQHIAKADVAVVVLDGSEALSPDDISLLGGLDASKCLVAVNKSDLPRGIDMDTVGQLASGACVVNISAHTLAGIGELKISLRQLLLGRAMNSSVVISSLRHKNSLSRGFEALDTAILSLSTGEPSELVAIDLHDACKRLEEIVGIVTNDDILESIFRDFCIGK